MRDEIRKDKKTAKIPLDSEMIVFEGCERDDKTLLGGRQAFMSHFCTFFNFSICREPQDKRSVQGYINLLNNPDKLDQSIDSFMKKYDDKK